MRILISGATGMVGRALTDRLGRAGHDVVGLTRNPHAKPPKEVWWNPGADRLEAAEVEGFEAVVHLAGESVAEGRWNEAKKARIRDSRVRGTALLATVLSKLQRKPRVLITASAIGYYGDRGDEVLTEASAHGHGFLPEVCVGWEAAAEPAKTAGIRTAHARLGMVLSRRGGALARMLLPFRLGLGGVLGSGRQVMSWVTLEDAVRAIVFTIENEAISGPFNVTAPNPVTNREFTKALGRVLHRPTIAPFPAFAARILFGEMADALLLAGARVQPKVLEDNGFKFNQTEIEEGLRAAIQ